MINISLINNAGIAG